MNWTAISAYISVGTLVIIAISAFIAMLELHHNFHWSRKKASQETLSRLVIGEFQKSLDELVLKFKWDPVNDKRTYSDLLKNISEEEKVEIDRVLTRVLRILETVFIHVKHDILDEEICYDYLASIVPNLYYKCSEFINYERGRRGNDERVFENFCFYAMHWDDRNLNYKKSPRFSVKGKKRPKQRKRFS